VTPLACELARLLAEALIADARQHPDLAQVPTGPETVPTRRGYDRNEEKPTP
jgi:hypothetical protein